MITGKLFQNEFVCQASIITWHLLFNEYVVLNVHDPDSDKHMISKIYCIIVQQ